MRAGDIGVPVTRGPERRRALALSPANVLRWALVAVFVGAGVAKLIGIGSMVMLFAMVGVGQWFRYAVGVYELIGAALLAYSGTRLIGTRALIVLMLGAAATEILILERPPLSSGITLLALIMTARHAT